MRKQSGGVRGDVGKEDVGKVERVNRARERERQSGRLCVCELA